MRAKANPITHRHIHHTGHDRRYDSAVLVSSRSRQQSHSRACRPSHERLLRRGETFRAVSAHRRDDLTGFAAFAAICERRLFGLADIIARRDRPV